MRLAVLTPLLLAASCSLGTDLGSHGAGALEPDADSGTLDAPDHSEPGPDTSDLPTDPGTDDADGDADAIADSDGEPPDAPVPDANECDEICPELPGARVIACDGDCRWACNDARVDANNDLGPGGDGCECSRTAPQEVCSDDLDNDCDGTVNEFCCDEQGWIQLAGQADGRRRNPTIDIDEDGNALLAWEEQVGDDPPSIRAVMRTSGEWADLEPIVSNLGARFPSATASPGNGFSLAWVQTVNSGQTSLLFRTHDANDGALLTLPAEFSELTQDLSMKSATVRSFSGRLMATWVQENRLSDDPLRCNNSGDLTAICARFGVQNGEALTFDNERNQTVLSRGRLARTTAKIGVVHVEEEDGRREIELVVIDANGLDETAEDQRTHAQTIRSNSTPDVVGWTDDNFVVGYFDEEAESLALAQLPGPDVTLHFAGPGARDPRFASHNDRDQVSVIWRDGGSLLHTTFDVDLTLSPMFGELWPGNPPADHHDVASRGTGEFAVIVLNEEGVWAGRFSPDRQAVCPE